MRSLFQIVLIAGSMFLGTVANAGNGGQEEDPLPSFAIGLPSQVIPHGEGCRKLTDKVTMCTVLTNCREDHDLNMSICDVNEHPHKVSP